MDSTHQIVLARDVWDDFTKELMHIDSGKQERINSFFEQISQTISVQHELNSITVESSRLDEDAILAALRGVSRTRYDMQVFDCMDACDLVAYVTDAEDKTYHSRRPIAKSKKNEYTAERNTVSALAA
ncbi:hypothetical protein [Sharpea azabuensis]